MRYSLLIVTMVSVMLVFWLPQATYGQIQPTPTSPLLASTPTLPPTPTPPLLERGYPPPLAMRLPDSWLASYQIVPLRVALADYAMNIAIYRGALADSSTGTLVIMWGFPSIAPPPTMAPLEGTPTREPLPFGDMVSQMLWSDGLRLLQGTLVDVSCNVGTTGQGVFQVGGVDGIGTFFNVAQCQGEPDTAGWFVGVRAHDRTYLFYAFIEPVEAYNAGRPQMQAILDSIEFLVPTMTPAPSLTPAP
ncbi:MAG: hypothetical protein OHK0023_18770 [Anaerolineae bacterium]